MQQLELYLPESTSYREHPLFADLAPHIVDQFIDYHRENPETFELFKRFAKDLVRAGRRHYGAKAIFERIRWTIEIERKGEFKCNNNFVAPMVRLLQFEEPQFAGFFETRTTPGTV